MSELFNTYEAQFAEDMLLRLFERERTILNASFHWQVDSMKHAFS